MISVRRIPVIAGTDIPHGAYCREADGKAFVDKRLKGPGGIAAGPHTALGYIPKGEPMQLQTDGPVMADLGRMVELRAGRIVK